MIGKGKTAGAGDNRAKRKLPKLVVSFLEQVCQCFLNICEMPFIICEKQSFIFIKDCNFDSGRTNVNSESMILHKK